MTKKEKALLKKAIRLIHHEDDYYGGMDILAKMAKMKIYDVKVGQVTIADLVKDGNTVFRVEE